MSDQHDKILDDLSKMGVDLGSWGVSKGGDASMSSIERQRESLQRLSAALNKMADNDRSTLCRLNEQLERLEHGGGS